MRASNSPPVQLCLRFTFHSDKSIEVEVLDFNSTFGNFVVQPSKITVPTGAAVEADPMTSRLGVAAVDEMALKVEIVRGTLNGLARTFL